MGQNASSECACQEGLFQLCAPEDPSSEFQNTTDVPGYPEQVRYVHADAGNMTSRNDAMPPPVMQLPRAQANSSPSTSPQGAHSGKDSMQPDVTVDDILSNLEGAEEILYGGAFAKLAGQRMHTIGLDAPAMRDFVCTNSALSMENIDVELLRVSSPDEGLSREWFLVLLREFTISDSDSITHFLGISADGETLLAEECRSGLLFFAQQKLSANFSDDRWECILNSVMWDADITVKMEQWMKYCTIMSRMVRLMRYAQVVKLANNGFGTRRKPGVIGGA